MSESQAVAEIMEVVKGIVRSRMTTQAYAVDSVEMHFKAGELYLTRERGERTRQHGRKKVDTDDEDK